MVKRKSIKNIIKNIVITILTFKLICTLLFTQTNHIFASNYYNPWIKKNTHQKIYHYFCNYKFNYMINAAYLKEQRENINHNLYLIERLKLFDKLFDQIFDKNIKKNIGNTDNIHLEQYHQLQEIYSDLIDQLQISTDQINKNHYLASRNENIEFTLTDNFAIGFLVADDMHNKILFNNDINKDGAKFNIKRYLKKHSACYYKHILYENNNFIFAYNLHLDLLSEHYLSRRKYIPRWKIIKKIKRRKNDINDQYYYIIKTTYHSRGRIFKLIKLLNKISRQIHDIVNNKHIKDRNNLQIFTGVNLYAGFGKYLNDQYKIFGQINFINNIDLLNYKDDYQGDYKDNINNNYVILNNFNISQLIGIENIKYNWGCSVSRSLSFYLKPEKPSYKLSSFDKYQYIDFNFYIKNKKHKYIENLKYDLLFGYFANFDQNNNITSHGPSLSLIYSL